MDTQCGAEGFIHGTTLHPQLWPQPRSFVAEVIKDRRFVLSCSSSSNSVEFTVFEVLALPSSLPISITLQSHLLLSPPTCTAFLSHFIIKSFTRKSTYCSSFQVQSWCRCRSNLSFRACCCEKSRLELRHIVSLEAAMGFQSRAIFAVVCLAMVGMVYGASFEEQFTAFSTDGVHVQVAPDGQEAKIVLDQVAASGFGSKHQYLFGNITMKIKLVPGDSAGTVTAYYLSSAQPAHDELDFEFLGNTSGEPYVLQTNVFANGVGGREQRINLWFDPSADFHNYGVLWNKNQIIFTVDEKPIRVFKNQQGMAYPNSKPMGLYASLWNGDQWATQGGLVKLNWTHAPFVVSFKEFSTLDGCVVTDNNINPCTATTSHWWEASAFQTIDHNQAEQILWVKQNYQVYDYCTDTERYPTEPLECSPNVPML